MSLCKYFDEIQPATVLVQLTPGPGKRRFFGVLLRVDRRVVLVTAARVALVALHQNTSVSIVVHMCPSGNEKVQDVAVAVDCLCGWTTIDGAPGLCAIVLWELEQLQGLGGNAVDIDDEADEQPTRDSIVLRFRSNRILDIRHSFYLRRAHVHDVGAPVFADIAGKSEVAELVGVVNRAASALPIADVRKLSLAAVRAANGKIQVAGGTSDAHTCSTGTSESAS